MMDGKIEWEALEMLSELMGVDDLERLIYDLITIRKYGVAKVKLMNQIQAQTRG